MSIYQLLREAIAALGDKPARIAALRESQCELTKKLPAARKRDEGIRRSRAARIQQIDEAIAASEGLDAELRAHCRAALRRALDSGEPGDAPSATPSPGVPETT
jgi:hypothetical protein